MVERRRPPPKNDSSSDTDSEKKANKKENENLLKTAKIKSKSRFSKRQNKFGDATKTAPKIIAKVEEIPKITEKRNISPPPKVKTPTPPKTKTPPPKTKTPPPKVEKPEPIQKNVETRGWIEPDGHRSIAPHRIG